MSSSRLSTHRQLEQSLGGLGHVHVGEWRQGVPHRGNHPLLEESHHHIDADDDLQNALQQESLPNPGSAREVQLVAQRGCKQEVEQVLDVQVVRVLH